VVEARAQPLLTYSAQPRRSRVTLEQFADGTIAVKLLPYSFRSSAFLILVTSVIINLCFTAALGRSNLGYGGAAAALARGPDAAALWAARWVAWTATAAVVAYAVLTVFYNKVTTVLIGGGVLRVRRDRWYWHAERQWPLDRATGTRVNWWDALLILDPANSVVCTLDVPERADLRWLNVLLNDLLQRRHTAAPLASAPP